MLSVKNRLIEYLKRLDMVSIVPIGMYKRYTQYTRYTMETQTWLEQCENWTPADDKLYDEGIKSGTAINPETNQPYTMEDIKQIIQSLPY